MSYNDNTITPCDSTMSQPVDTNNNNQLTRHHNFDWIRLIKNEIMVEMRNEIKSYIDNKFIELQGYCEQQIRLKINNIIDKENAFILATKNIIDSQIDTTYDELEKAFENEEFIANVCNTYCEALDIMRNRNKVESTIQDVMEAILINWRNRNWQRCSREQSIT